MKTIKITAFLFALVVLFASCYNSNKSVDGSAGENQDSVALTDLVRQAYKWRETTTQKEDFATQTNNLSDSSYSGIDWNAHDARIKVLNESNFFSKEFMDGYQKIALHIDEELKTGKTVWLVDDISPFGSDSNPWCNCQDYPNNYWDKITLANIVFNADDASFSWTWGDNFYYKANAKKNNGIWKISYLEGFDFDAYTGAE